MNPSTAFAAVLVDELLRGGVTDAVLAPGSRSAPVALALASAAVDLRVTQVVNGGVHGVHAVLPPGRLEIAG